VGAGSYVVGGAPVAAVTKQLPNATTGQAYNASIVFTYNGQTPLDVVIPESDSGINLTPYTDYENSSNVLNSQLNSGHRRLKSVAITSGAGTVALSGTPTKPGIYFLVVAFENNGQPFDIRLVKLNVTGSAISTGNNQNQN